MNKLTATLMVALVCTGAGCNKSNKDAGGSAASTAQATPGSPAAPGAGLVVTIPPSQPLGKELAGTYGNALAAMSGANRGTVIAFSNCGPITCDKLRDESGALAVQKACPTGNFIAITFSDGKSTTSPSIFQAGRQAGMSQATVTIKSVTDDAVEVSMTKNPADPFTSIEGSVKAKVCPKTS